MVKQASKTHNLLAVETYIVLLEQWNKQAAVWFYNAAPHKGSFSTLYTDWVTVIIMALIIISGNKSHLTKANYFQLQAF